MKNFELISFSLCPYVQRSVITLLRKKAEYKITYIDLNAPPAWFQKISPLGKVPLLLVRESPESEPTVLFESAVINEYVDEVLPPSFVHRDPLRKAQERGWVEVASELQGKVYHLSVAADEAAAGKVKEELWKILLRVEGQIPGGAFFRGAEFSLVDSAFAPVFSRLVLLRGLAGDPQWEKIPKVKAWRDGLLALPEVHESVLPSFAEDFRAWTKAHGGFLA